MKHLFGLFVVMFSLFSMTSLGAEVQEYQIPSSIDTVKQRVLLCAPETEAPVPLLVSLHTWSAHCDRYDAYETGSGGVSTIGMDISITRISWSKQPIGSMCVGSGRARCVGCGGVCLLKR